MQRAHGSDGSAGLLSLGRSAVGRLKSRHLHSELGRGGGGGVGSAEEINVVFTSFQKYLYQATA